MNDVNRKRLPRKIKSVDLCIYSDILKPINNHAEWCEGTGHMITQQPYPKGANVSPDGNHEVKYDNRKNETSYFGRFFCWLMKFYFLINQEIPNVKMDKGDRCIGNLEM
jgi:hypothetical protein